jgi:hypothetical protein
MRFWLTLLLLPCLLAAWAGSAQAELSLSLKLNRQEIAMGESARLVVTLSGTQNADTRPSIQGLEDFTVSPGGTSSRMEIINGKVSSKLEFNFFVQPRAEGEYSLGPAVIKTGGKVYTSSQVKLKVLKSPAKVDEAQGPLFLHSSISPARVYPEQPAIYTLKLYRRVQVRDLGLQLPDTPGLSFRQLGEPREYPARAGGRSYQVLEVRYAVLAAKPGVYGIAPARLKLTVLESGGSQGFGGFFNDPFFSSGRPEFLSSQPLELEAKPFPQENRPADFSGLAGQFSLEAKLEPGKLKAGESATLTLRVSGQGNLQRIPDLSLPELPGIKVYADQPVLKADWDQKGQHGKKVMKWALVPEKEGQYSIPTPGLTYFDSQSGGYKTIAGKALQLSALPSGQPARVVPAAPKAARKAPARKQEIKELGSDILPIHASLRGLAASPQAGFPGWVHILALAAPLLLYLGALLFLKLSRRSDEALTQSRAKKAAKLILASCSDPELSNEALIIGLKDYFNHKFGLSLGVLTSHEAVKLLKERGCDPETVEAAQDCIRGLEDTVYCGLGGSCTELGQKAAKLVKDLERQIR